MRISSPEWAPQQSFQPNSSQESSSASSSLKTEHRTPPLLSERFSSVQDVHGDFPPDHWLNIVNGYAVDLAKVLRAHYPSGVEAEQSQDPGDLFELSWRVKSMSSPKPSSQRSLLPCQVDTPRSMLPRPSQCKHHVRAFLP